MSRNATNVTKLLRNLQHPKYVMSENLPELPRPLEANLASKVALQTDGRRGSPAVTAHVRDLLRVTIAGQVEDRGRHFETPSCHAPTASGTGLSFFNSTRSSQGSSLMRLPSGKAAIWVTSPVFSAGADCISALMRSTLSPLAIRLPNWGVISADNSLERSSKARKNNPAFASLSL